MEKFYRSDEIQVTRNSERVKLLCAYNVQLTSLKEADDDPLNILGKILQEMTEKMIAHHGNNNDKFAVQILHEFLENRVFYLQIKSHDTNVGDRFLSHIQAAINSNVDVDIFSPFTFQLWVTKLPRQA